MLKTAEEIQEKDEGHYFNEILKKILIVNYLFILFKNFIKIMLFFFFSCIYSAATTLVFGVT